MIAIDIPLIVLIFQGIPEEIGIVTLAYAIAGIPFRWKELIPMGTVLALTAYFLRLCNLPFGTHTIVLVVLVFLFLTLRSKKDVSVSLFASLVSYMFLIVFEFISINLFIVVLNIPVEAMFADSIGRILFTEPQVILLFITAFLIRRKKMAHD
ncbi:hypothetical protein SAMN02745215_04779 [Desulfitobacterium chlororespirans DSM 11544]|uniref:Uncharacterized protein n=1 Tax=Desulfitobacterium chlororespirans DSM 11544 TaxID=1121395 RepID=A0A1M7UVI1_9FIRM|nr:hypothetical protein SAMN02745215_04779 [Desulfitobacterium chlororespirans DSM 11544]